MSELAVIYCRKSNPSAASNDPAFEQQEAACRKYCDEHGYTVLVARRESYTGTDLDNQALLWDTIDDVKCGRASVVIAYSYDRLSREPQMQEVALYEIEKKYGGRFEAATEQIDRNEPFREAIRAMLGAASKMERKRITERTRRGMVDRAARGGLYGTANPKYGYRWADDTPGERRSFEIDPDNAAIVHRIFDWFDNGKGIRQIARQLNAEGIPTPSQAAAEQGHVGRRIVGDSWRHVAIWRMLQDPAYCGKMSAYRQVVSHEYQKNRTTGIMEKKRVVANRDIADPARIEIECPAIVSVEQFQRVQLVLASHKPKEGRPPLDPEAAVMRGHVYCKCGRKMVLQRSHGYYVYRCSARPTDVTNPSLACLYRGQEITADKVNEYGAAMAIELSRKAGVLQQFLENRDQDSQPLRDMTERLKALVDRKTAEHGKWLEAIPTAKNPATIQALTEKADKCAEELEDAQAKLAEAIKRLNSVDQKRAAFSQVVEKIALVTPEGIRNMSDEELRNLADLIGLKIKVSPTSANHNGTRVFHTAYGETELEVSPDGYVLLEVSEDGKQVTPVAWRWPRLEVEYNLRGDLSGSVSVEIERLGRLTNPVVAEE